MAKRTFIPGNPKRKYKQETESGKERYHDLGFSSTVNKHRRRFINKDGTHNVKQKSNGVADLHLYQWLVLMSWPQFALATVLFYFILNTIFTCLYLLNGIENLAGLQEGLSPFWNAFFFSAQTLTTVGYGSLSPMGFTANLIAALGALSGLMSFALGTGLMFARFSKPSANIKFSDNALIGPYKEGGKALMFRLANKRKNMITNLRVEVVATWVGVDEHGNQKRKYAPLMLERDHLSMLPLSWTVVHPINDKSPVFNYSKEICEQMNIEVIVVLEGYDDTFANIIRAQSSYKFNEIVWGAKFVPAFHVDEEGYSILEIEKLNTFKTINSL